MVCGVYQEPRISEAERMHKLWQRPNRGSNQLIQL